MTSKTLRTFSNANPKNFGVKRIMREYKDFRREPHDAFDAAPLEVGKWCFSSSRRWLSCHQGGCFSLFVQDNMFEWHFTLRGVDGTDYEGGRWDITLSSSSCAPSIVVSPSLCTGDLSLPSMFLYCRYHGRILLPSQYPFKPPDIILLTVTPTICVCLWLFVHAIALAWIALQPSGRFQTGKKICLSITGYHPKNWQPNWSSNTSIKPWYASPH